MTLICCNKVNGHVHRCSGGSAGLYGFIHSNVACIRVNGSHFFKCLTKFSICGKFGSGGRDRLFYIYCLNTEIKGGVLIFLCTEYVPILCTDF